MSTTTNRRVTTAAFDSTATFEPSVGAGTVLVTGSATDAIDIANIEVYDNGIDLGGTGGFRVDNPSWQFTATLAPGRHDLTATVTELSGSRYSVSSSYELVTGIRDQPFVYREIDRNASGDVVATTSYASNGSVVSRSVDGGNTVDGNGSSGEVIRSVHNDLMSGDGTGGTTFQFRRGFGRDEITNFNYLSAAQSSSGIEHDIVSLPGAMFQTLAQVLRHTSRAPDGDAVIHLSETDRIKLDGVTKENLITHPDVFRLRP